MGIGSMLRYTLVFLIGFISVGSNEKISYMSYLEIFTKNYAGVATGYDESDYIGINYDEDYDKIYKEICDMLGMDELERQLKLNGLDYGISFSQLVNGMVNRDTEGIREWFFDTIMKLLALELIQNKELLIQLVCIVLIGSIFVNLSNSFGNGFVSENGFYVTYLIITSIMLTSFSVTLEMVSGSMEKILMLVRIMVPVFAIAMNFVGHAITSYGMYNIILIGVWLVEAIILKLIIPMIKFFVIISLVNNLNKEDSFSKLCSLVKNLVGWLLKTIVFFVLGLNIIKSLIEPQLDALGKNTVNRVVSAIPGGGVMSVVTGTFLGAGLVIKNSVGIAGMILIGTVALIPILKTFVIMLMVKITAAIIQPIGEKRYVDGIESLSIGVGLLLEAVASAVALFMLTIAVMTYASG